MSALINVLLGLIVIGLAVGLTISLIKLSNVKNGSNKFTCGTGTKPGPLGLECVPIASEGSGYGCGQGTKPGPLGLECVPIASEGSGYGCGQGTKPGPLGMKCIPDLNIICTGKLQPGPDNNCVIKAGECASPDGTQNICTEECCVRTLNMKWENGVCKPKDGFALCPNDKMSSGGTCVDVPVIDSPPGEISCGECTVISSDGTECIMSTDPACVGTGTGTGTDAQSQTTSEPSKTARDAAIALAVLASVVGVIFYLTKVRPETREAVGAGANRAWTTARGGASKVWGSARGAVGSVTSRIPGVRAYNDVGNVAFDA
ncbi:hypothetical protein EXVG_00312 [Emiliania huxleyi virus 202]|nr:hypothetical protein EXVG_00312 [Emiliania huxleyi virus 202]AHA54240.1 putative membrane protein [Emiliania huxleyi virus 18]AHA55288.1 putative membrane protein [Emiliania huxleyi virus 156]